MNKENKFFFNNIYSTMRCFGFEFAVAKVNLDVKISQSEGMLTSGSMLSGKNLETVNTKRVALRTSLS